MEGAGGSFTVAPELASGLIDLARSKSVCISAGAQTIMMNAAEMKVPRLTGDVTAYWRPEGATITTSEPAFGALNLTAKTVAVLTSASVELIEDSPAAADGITRSIAAALGLAMDYAMLEGQGAAEQPMGLANDSGVQQYAVSATVTRDNFGYAVGLSRAANYEPTAIVYSARTARQMDLIKSGDGLYLTGPPSWEALPKFVSTQIPETEGGGTATHAFVGPFNELAFAIRTQLTLETFRYGNNGSFDAMSRLGVWFRAYMRLDTYIPRPGGFVKMTGLAA
jgi:HK97 family phage major capsid protein